MANIYFSGIGGVGIGPLAQIAVDAGYQVQGSDAQESLVTKELQARGVQVFIGQDGKSLEDAHRRLPIDWFVYTSALPADHPELVLAKKLGIKAAKRDELLAHIISEKKLKLIAIAGTHGKTTTTSMTVWLFLQLGIPVSYSIGSTIQFGPSGKFDPQSEFFVYECDEFDRNFLHFTPYLSLITAIGYDHPDTYRSEPDYLASFKQFINQSDKSILWRSDAKKISASGKDVLILDENETLQVKLVGAHNRRNATLVSKAAQYLQLAGHEPVIAALERFPGSDRRFERLADNLYTDYGHHPTEIAATLQLARELSDHIVLVYQPHQNIRQHTIRTEYAHSFELADTIYWLPTYLSREDPSLAVLAPQEVAEHVTNKGSIVFAQLDDSLWSAIEDARKAGKLVLMMGAGSIDKWAREKVTQAHA